MADYDFLLPDEWDSTWDDVMSPCECPQGPRQFLIPPPPPPPAMGVCGGSPLGGGPGVDRAPGYFCHLEPMGAEFTQAGFPSLPVIAVCSSVVVVAVLVASFLIWRHKTKVQNLLPCKHDHHHQPGGHCDMSGAGQNGVTYEDVLINHHPTRLPLAGPPMVGGQTLMPMELLDVKLGDMVPPESSTLHPGSYYPASCRSNNSDQRIMTAKPFHPMYEEIAREPTHARKSSAASKSYDSDFDESGGIGGGRGGRSFTSEDDFAEDELSGLEYPSGEGSRHCSATSSVQGSTGGDLCRDPVSSDDGAGEDCDGYHPASSTSPFGGYPAGKPINNLRGAGNPLNRIQNINGEAQQKTFGSISDDHHNPFMHAGGDINSYPVGPPQVPHCGVGVNKWPAYCGMTPPHDSRESLDSPVENIYSTIDEGDVSPIAPNPSRAHQLGQNLVPCSKRPNPSGVNKKHHQGSNPRQQLHHKKPGEVKRFQEEEDSESYGDIMPAYDSTASCVT